MSRAKGEHKGGKKSAGKKTDSAATARKNGRQPGPEERMERVFRELYEAARTIAAEYGLARGEPFPIPALQLPVRVDLETRPTAEAQRERAAELVDIYRDRILEGLTAHKAFRMGRVYCFQCDAPDCVHGGPTDPVDTFIGYTATGKPSWEGFANVCLARGFDRVDRLYGDHPEVVALVQMADELSGELLPGFGSGSLAYNVQGQVVLGLIPEELKMVPGAGNRVALTVQVVETRTGIERSRLRLNVLGLTVDQIAEAADRGPARSVAARLAESLRIARQRLHSLGRQVQLRERRGSELDLAERISPLLHQLRGDLERIFKVRHERTRHAREHHEAGQRPIGQARSDTKRASHDRFLLDVRNKTVVVLGPKSRAHIFSIEGKHVTSLQLDPHELERKMAKRRWRPMAMEDVVRFREVLST
jgi:hypothetical protein